MIKKEMGMNRKYIALLGNSLIMTAIITTIIFGFYGSVIWGFCGGISQLVDGIAGGDGVKMLMGIMKIMCCGTIAVLTIYLVQRCLRVIDWIYAWKAGKA